MSNTDADLLTKLLHRRPDEDVLITNATILSMDPNIGDLETGDILIRGSQIEAVGTDLAHAAADGQRLVIDATGSIAIPGLQDTHRHCWQTHMRRALVDTDVGAYIGLMHGELGPLYSAEDVYLGTYLGALTALEHGVTTVLDFCHNRRSVDHADQAMAGLNDAGIRSIFTPVGPVFGEWDGAWREDLVRMRASIFASANQLMRLRVGVFAPLDPELIKGDHRISAETIGLARELEIGVACDGVLGEGASRHVEALGRTPGVLGPDVTLIHCNALSPEAWQVIADTGTRVALAPTSDAQLGMDESVPPIQQALDVGVLPGLSVDTEMCLSSDMFTQMRVALNVQRMLAAQRHYHGHAGAPSLIPCRDVLVYSTIGGAIVNGVDDVAGTLTPGKQADIVLIRADDLDNMPLNSAVATVVLGSAPHNVERVMVGGRPRKWGRELVGCDVPALRRRIVESRDRILHEAGKPLSVVDRANAIA